MPKLLVIADDLTGANDVGAQFAKQGIPVLVRPGISTEAIRWTDGLEVLAVSTESRHLDAAEASLRVRAAVRMGTAAGVDCFYKKTDSTMRGNIGSEMEALLTASGHRILPFIPAIPQLSRTTLGGCQFVGQTLLHKSDFADDPIDLIGSSYIPAIIARQSGIPAWVIEVAQLGYFEGSELRAGIYVFDATTNDDLLKVGAWLKRQGLLTVVAGSAGFASLMPNLLNFARRPLSVPRMSGRMLVVNGSLNAASLEQVARAGREDFAVITLPPELLVPSCDGESQDAEQTVAEILRLEGEGRDVVIQSIAPGDSLRRYLKIGEQLGFTPKEVHLTVAENIGRLVSRIMTETGFKVMAVFGGDTLAAVVRSLGWSGLRPLGEITPGVVALEVADKRDFLLLSKAGGFGGTDLLGRVKDYLRSNER